MREEFEGRVELKPIAIFNLGDTPSLLLVLAHVILRTILASNGISYMVS